ncbi:hypothetical protein A5753_12540 [Mycobacterium sp. 852002-51971_SCH5477799-a]|uniref:hypothetical protein n=1 Tax=Mycobacterium sp. 852002-51971_SCH5477799-a TaxID=1834106 RepID=UPI000802120A|nr:hypothetical protein [Mycobacterium sp. 852002-51971_SCH5477799-a]OBF63336.1 hypothetical protein A5753_12540 [Mycobacterium sp. 852002-51971_SCH5477799-a]
MADRLDVAARLAEGRAAVEHAQTYVQACHALGYQNTDLTTHPVQVRERYASEDGLDLRVLDRDCAELRAAGVVAAEALRMQRGQVAELAAAWTGPGADAAVQLLQRHCDTGDAVVTELRAAAQRCESLRDNLWYLVDSEVATAIAVDDRVRVQRPAWLAAAAAVLAGDRDGAAEVVRQQLMPYVDNDIRNDWVTAMRSASDGVETAYAMVIDKMTAVPTARFEFPGDLGAGIAPVQLAPPVDTAPVPTVDPAPTLAAAVPDPVGAATTPVTPAPPPAAAPPANWGTALGDALGVPAGDLGGLGGGFGGGDLGSGLGDGDLGSGLGGGLGGGGGLLGLAGRIVDAVAGLIGSTGDGPDGADVLSDGENPFDETPFDADDPEDTVDVADDEAGADETPDDPDDPVDISQPVSEPQPGPDDTPVEAPPPADTAEPDAPPAPPAAPVAEPAPAAGQGSTPCEIAADQLPQAGQ